MKHYIAKTASGDFSAIVERVVDSLKTEGFGVLTDIDVKTTMKKSSTSISEIIDTSVRAIPHWRIKR